MIFMWFIRLKETYGFIDQTPLSAIAFFDKFTRKNNQIEPEMHHFIGMICFILAMKMNEDKCIEMEQAAQLCQKECGLEYSVEMFMHAEF
jgi:hypothetical protein